MEINEYIDDLYIEACFGYVIYGMKLLCWLKSYHGLDVEYVNIYRDCFHTCSCWRHGTRFGYFIITFFNIDNWIANWKKP